MTLGGFKRKNQRIELYNAIQASKENSAEEIALWSGDRHVEVRLVSFDGEIHDMIKLSGGQSRGNFFY